MSRGLATASRIACSVISLKTMRPTGTLGRSTSMRCQEMASPSRSSSVASRSASASLRAFFRFEMVCAFDAWMTYSGWKSPSTSTASLAQGFLRSSAGISETLEARSRI